MDRTSDDLKQLQTHSNGHALYYAGLPEYRRIFTRDSIISAILMQDATMLREQLLFCAEKQGVKKNSITGEEPGKIFHELPPVSIRKLLTEYNACDTTALYIIGHEIYQMLTGDHSLCKQNTENIRRAANYIIKHVDRGGAFFEDPALAGGEHFALKVTYWKDSELFGRKGGEPSYPVIYSLAHVQNARALLSAAELLNDASLVQTASHMIAFLTNKLYDSSDKNFYLAIDREGSIRAINSDMLHALFYLKEGDLTPDCIASIINNAETLETPIGYRTLCEECSVDVKDEYHTRSVWPFEQALIHIGARKHKKWAESIKDKNLTALLQHVMDVSSGIIGRLSTSSHERFTVDHDGKNIKKSGSDPQLWSIAAKQYFAAPDQYTTFL